MGDGTRTTQASKDALEVFGEIGGICGSFKSNAVTDSPDEMKKFDPNSLHYAGPAPDGSTYDVPLDVATKCEIAAAGRRGMLEDNYVRDEAPVEKYTTCGYEDWTFRAVLVGSNQFGEFESPGTPIEAGVKDDCKHLKKGIDVPKELKDAVKGTFAFFKNGDGARMERNRVLSPARRRTPTDR